jgi:hypothetical protein
MQRDLVERRGWVNDRECKLGLALAQIMPGPLAAQLAIALGYFLHGVLGATLVGLVFVLPSFLMVLALSARPALIGCPMVRRTGRTGSSRGGRSAVCCNTERPEMCREQHEASPGPEMPRA